MEHGLVGGVGREKRLNGSRGYLPGWLGYIIHLLLIPTYDECLLRVLCLSSLNDLIHRESKNTYLVWYTETNNIIYFAWSFNLGLIFPPKKVQRKNEVIKVSRQWEEIETKEEYNVGTTESGNQECRYERGNAAGCCGYCVSSIGEVQH